MAEFTRLSVLMLLLTCISSVVNLIAISAPYWGQYTPYSVYFTESIFGPWQLNLWRKCNLKFCIDFKLTALKAAVVSMMILALLFIVAAAVLSALYVLLEKLRKKLVVITIGVTAFASALFCLAAVIVFAVDMKRRPENKFLVGFYLAIVHCILSLCGGIVGVVIALRTHVYVVSGTA